MTTFKERLLWAISQIEPKPSPADIAREAGISRAAVSKWFSGETKRLDIEPLFKIARFLRVDAEWLGTGHGKPERGVDRIRNELRQGMIENLRNQQERFTNELKGLQEKVAEQLRNLEGRNPTEK
jgi:transcriptional regulator with XRE-family HTH domain